MRPYFLIFSLFIATSNAKAQGCNNNVAKKYIDGLFQKGEYLSYDSTQFPGYDKELTQLKTPFLNKLLPGYCFFKTTFLVIIMNMAALRLFLPLQMAQKRNLY